MDAPNPKRSRKHGSSSTKNLKSLPTTPNLKQNQLDSIISSLLSLPESSSSISQSIDRVLDKALASASDDVSVQDQLVNRTLELQSVLLESTKRCYRKRASVHNSNSWFLPPELTIKVFSMLDTKSLMHAMVCCTMFKQRAMEPLSYSHINLTTSAKNVKNDHVIKMINRAGKELRFLELGHAIPLAKSATPLLTGACLAPLSSNEGFIGKSLRTLHLYDIRYMKDKASISALSACSSLTDLKIVGMYSPCEQLLKSLTTKCLFIEKLFLETYGFPNRSRKESPALVEFLTNIFPNLTSISLIGFRVKDTTLETLTASSRKLKHMDLSRNTTIKGRFLRDSGSSFHDGPLETLILRDCSSLEEKEVSQFLDSISTGNFRFIRHIDVSNNRGIISGDGKKSHYPKFPLEKLKEERPNVKFLADFTSSEPPRPRKIAGVVIGPRNVVRFDSEPESSSSEDSSSDDELED